MRYDLIIVGGGLVGAGFAAALKDSHLRIALIDARMPTMDDPRLFALNASSCQFLENLGFWKQLQPYAAPIKQVQVSHQGHFGAVRMHHADVNLPALGHVVPACHIEHALNDALTTQANVDIYRPARLKSLTQSAGMAELLIDLNDKEIQLQTPIVIGADGTASTVRTLANIDIEKIDYQQSAIVTRVKLKRGHDNIAYERFYSRGALAMLPLADNECACILSAEQAEIERVTALSDEMYLQEIQKLIGFRLGHLDRVGKRHCFPLQLLCAKNPSNDCVLLLGNAAHTLHPIAAQGFNLALYEAAVLAEGMLAKSRNQERLTTANLAQLLQKSRKQQTVSVKVSHWLTRIFSSQNTIANCLISAGMLSFNLITPVKTRFMNLMTGRSGRVPSLLIRQPE
jgi:2-octaprenyl-6-methoxyphenol hydroxylase